MNHLLSVGQVIEGSYTVTFLLKKGTYAETYRVKDRSGKPKVLKLIDYSRLHRSQFDVDGNVLEFEILKYLEHPNLLQLRAWGDLLVNQRKFAYGVFDLISGETLADRMKRDAQLNPFEAKRIILGILNGLHYLHSRPHPVIHNDLTNLNIMLDLSGSEASSKIIDFGHARYISQSHKDFLKEGLNPFYQAQETSNSIFSPQSDLFSVGALYYHLLVGSPPWFSKLSPFKKDRIEEVVLEARQKPLQFPETSFPMDQHTMEVIKKALQPIAEHRFTNALEFIQAIQGVREVSNVLEKNTPEPILKRTGKGFSGIAGMQGLKETLQLDVIDALKDPKRYSAYGLTIPNGMLLYGPPGCGKTYFAERLVEEIGFQFYQIKPSDLQSKWVNATQEHIKNLFEEARSQAPSIIFLDELDALVPRREAGLPHMHASAVNEFLAQMNNSGEDGIFIIGATNRPTMIDPAILRAGRLDKHIFVPPPDVQARISMFKMYLENRPRELGLDYTVLAEATENYMSSDLKLICDEAARWALKQKSRITQQLLLDTIRRTVPSISEKEMSFYLNMKDHLEGKPERHRIGFKK